MLQNKPASGNDTIRILVVDDHQLMRVGICAILSNNSGWKVCGEAENGRQAVDKVLELKPDLVILDISMPELNGVEAAREIRLIAPAVKIIILTMHDRHSIESPAREAGADAVATKSMAGASLIPLIEGLFELKSPVHVAIPTVADAEIRLEEVNSSETQDQGLPN
jgi:DNA-binding NarL/FixJ family response regulator